jgi:2-octaprenyl-6-methoxyphenol hydroxylase
MNNYLNLIVGCSYNGMLTALFLAANGIKSTIIEKRKCDESFFYDPRTTSITAGSKEFFDHLGIWSQLEPYVSPIDQIYVLDNKSPTQIHFDNSEVDNASHLGHMIPNYYLKQTLYSIVSQNKLIEIIDNAGYKNVDFKENNTALHLEDGQEFNADLIIVCDGKNSNLRAKYFPYLINKDYKQIAFVFNVSCEKNHENTAVEHFLPTGGFAILPLSNQKESSVVWCVEVDLAIMYQALDLETFTQQVQDLFGDFLGKIQITSKISSFNLSAQIVKNYFFKNLVLVGDVAHSIHPLAGQGLNQGVKDITALGDIIKKYTSLGLDINSIALEEYQKARYKDNLQMFLATNFLDKIFSNKSKSLASLRRIGFNFLNHFPEVKRQIIRYGVK